MKWLPFGLVLVVCLGAVAFQQADQPPAFPAPPSRTPDQHRAAAPIKLPPIEVHFSLKGGCIEAVVMEINPAKTSILVEAYSFTSTPIAKALVAAHKRGLKVEVILDKSNRTKNYSAADFVLHGGIRTLIDAKHVRRPSTTGSPRDEVRPLQTVFIPHRFGYNLRRVNARSQPTMPKQ